MATPPPTAAELKRREDMINICLSEGYAPHGQSGGKGSAVEEAMRRMGLLGASTTIRWIRSGKINPDWTLYRPQAAAPIPPLDIPEAPIVQEKPRVRIQAGRPGGSKYKVLAIGDSHDGPHVPKDRFRWLAKLAGDQRPDVVVQIGDLLTLDSLNTHIPDETFEGRLKGTYLEDIASGNTALGEFGAALPGGYEPRCHITLGNHERRVWRAESTAPHVAGMMQLELTSMLDRHKWSYSEYGEFWFLGGVGFVHVPLNRLGKTYGGKTAENQVANDAVFDIVFGHSHTRQVKMAPKIGPAQHVMVVNLGCSLPHGWIEDYAMHAVTGWTYGAEMITIQGGHITETNFVSMASLEDRYGKAA